MTSRTRDQERRAGGGLAFCRAVLEISRADAEHQAALAADLLEDVGPDWRTRADHVAASGLARVVFEALWRSESNVPRSPFLEAIREAALQEAGVRLIQREALQRINDRAAALGATGVLLKGTALRSLPGAATPPRAHRAAGDIDVYVAPPHAHQLRASLLAHGFHGDEAAPRTAPHHLAPILFNGTAIEIHTRIMPEFWGLPEAEMLDRSRPSIDGAALRTLDVEGMLVHTGIHSTSHLFSHGFKTAWDLAWLLESPSHIDWDRVDRWVRAVRLPRSFWVPVTVLAREMAIPFPPAFLQRAAMDARAHRLEAIARDRLFDATESAFDLNPISRNLVFLLLSDSWPGRARYVASLFGPDASEARHEAMRLAPAQGWRHMPRHVAETWRQVKKYR